MNHPTDLAQRQRRRVSLGLGCLAAVSAAIALLLITADAAEAGAYRAAQCNPGLGAGHADLVFRRTSPEYRAGAACGANGDGLVIRHRGEGVRGRREGAWLLRIPPQTALIGARAAAGGAAAGGHVPEVVSGAAPGALRTVARLRAGLHRIHWRAGARVIGARLRCTRSAGCGAGRDAALRLRRIMLMLRDEGDPQLDLGGALLDGATHRGNEAVEAAVADAGAGVRRVVLEVNGEPAATRDLGCAVARGIALRVRPCPTSRDVSINARTRSDPFRQGPNLIRACAFDFSGNSDTNRRCASGRVRIDNACPVSGEGTASRLWIRVLRHAREHRSLLRGRLLDGDSRGLAGARVCVATRTRLPGSPERVVATPSTGAGGRFSVLLPPGPNRELRVAYWADEDAVVERYGALRTRARPSLRIRPHRALHNGDAARFRVRLRGPAAAHRWVSLRVRSHGRWLPLRGGRTNRRGIWRSSYRFHATTGDFTYRFRAFVPRQRGYPFQAGRSGTRVARVIG
jgi:hypothetical protein